MGKKYRIDVDDVTITLEVTRYGNFVKIEIEGSHDKYRLKVWDHGVIKLSKLVVEEKEIEPIEGD